MSLIVQKFGGSSVRDYAHLLRMARIVKSRVDEGDDVSSSVRRKNRNKEEKVSYSTRE